MAAFVCLDGALGSGQQANQVAATGKVTFLTHTSRASNVGSRSNVSSNEPSYNSAETSAPLSVGQATTTIPTAGLVIQATFDSSITSNSNSALIQTAINQAIAKFQSLFRDNVTVSILFRFATTDPFGVTLPTGTLAQSLTPAYQIPWSQYISALTADAKTTNDATANASLPTTPLSTNIIVSSANGRAVGLSTPPVVFVNVVTGINGTYDGIVTINSGEPFQFTRPPGIVTFDALTAIEHEMDEILGLGSYLNTGGSDLRPQDLFSWFTVGGRNLTITGTRYFSIDGGTTPIINFNQDPTGDFGDWLSPACPQTRPYVQNAFLCSGTNQDADIGASSPEGINLDVIGYDLVVPIDQKIPGSYVFTIPSGTQQLILEAWGAGGGGGVTTNFTSSGGGGGAYTTISVKVTSADWLKKISYTVGTGGQGGVSKSKGTDGTASNISCTLHNGNLAINLHAGAGKAGGNGGYGGVTSGGTTPSTDGNFAPSIIGGSGAMGGGLQGIGGGPKLPGSAPGGGGGGPINNGAAGSGANGEVRITFF